jgi:hypothetical protein
VLPRDRQHLLLKPHVVRRQPKAQQPIVAVVAAMGAVTVAGDPALTGLETAIEPTGINGRGVWKADDPHRHGNEHVLWPQVSPPVNVTCGGCPSSIRDEPPLNLLNVVEPRDHDRWSYAYSCWWMGRERRPEGLCSLSLLRAHGEGPRGLAKVCDLRQCYRRLPTDLAARSGIIHAGHGRASRIVVYGLWPVVLLRT